jgi:hypothetical protein
LISPDAPLRDRAGPAVSAVVDLTAYPNHRLEHAIERPTAQGHDEEAAGG